MCAPRRSRSLVFELLDDRRLLSATPIRVDDINTTPVPWSSSDPYGLTEVNGVLYYAATDGITGSELWRSDGSEQGTYRVKDIAAGAPGSGPAALTNVDGLLYFVANWNQSSHELWKSDGTESGTVLVKSLSIDAESTGDFFKFSDLRKVGDSLYFRRDSLFDHELWVSDGTAAGTVMVADVVDASSIEMNGQLFYVGADGDLWKVGGTAAAPARVKEFTLSPSRLINVGGELYFTVDEGYWGNVTIWKSDGSEVGTVEVRKLKNGFDGLRDFVSVDGILYFTYDDLEQGDRQLWKTNGASSGTTLVKDFGEGNFAGRPNGLVEFQGKLYFGMREGQETNLWTSDGSEAGTVRVASLGYGSRVGAVYVPRVIGQMLYFVAQDNSAYRNNGDVLIYGLWHSDGTTDGTSRIATIDEGPYLSDRIELEGVNGRPFFRRLATPDEPLRQAGVELWTLDETLSEVVMVRDVNGPSGHSNAADFTALGNQLLFVADDGVHGMELWKLDALGGAPALLKDTRPGPEGGANGRLNRVGDQAFFTVRYGSSDAVDLWRTDGTAAGTVRLTFDHIGPDNIVEFNGRLYFTARLNGAYEVWSSDGTVAGTAPVTKFAEFGLSQHVPSKLTVHGDRVYFAYGSQLWSTDGTWLGSAFVVNAAPEEPTFSLVNLTSAGEYLFFSAWNGLWRSDGTTAGSIRLTQIQHDSARPYYQSGFATAGERIVFRGNDLEHGYELWVSDGTIEGTRMVVDATPGAANSSLQYLAPFNGRVFYSFATSTGDSGLWSSDGTAAGTQLVHPTEYPAAKYLTAVGGVLYFQGRDAEHGAELWRTDGTVAGTRRVGDQQPGSSGSYPQALTNVNGNLFYLAFDAEHGREPWFVPRDPVAAAGDFDRNGTIDGTDFLHWQRTAGAASALGDADDDLAVDATDLALWQNGFGVFGTVATDFNRDGLTDGADFLAWQRGGGRRIEPADADRSGEVDAADLAVWRSSFGNRPPLAGQSGAASAPIATAFDATGKSWMLSGMASSAPADASVRDALYAVGDFTALFVEARSLRPQKRGQASHK